jgi:hypothetical protein
MTEIIRRVEEGKRLAINELPMTFAIRSLVSTGSWLPSDLAERLVAHDLLGRLVVRERVAEGRLVLGGLQVEASGPRRGAGLRASPGPSRMSSSITWAVLMALLRYLGSSQ